MSSRIRFASASSVFDAFPDLRRVAATPAESAAPLDHARALLASRPPEAVMFIAHLLPRREAVWWAVQCVRGLLGARSEDEAFHAADAWTRAPEEVNRCGALAVAGSADQEAPTTWLAFAAGWSGGSVTPPGQQPLPAPASACALGANTAVMLAAARGDPREVAGRIKACAEAGIRFAEGGDAMLSLPTGRQPAR